MRDSPRRYAVLVFSAAALASCAVSSKRGLDDDDLFGSDASIPGDGAVAANDGGLDGARDASGLDGAMLSDTGSATVMDATGLGDAQRDADGVVIDAGDEDDVDGGVPDADEPDEPDTGPPDSGRVDAGEIDAGDCVEGRNGDGDGLSDCEEVRDGDDWTDLAVFNGMLVRTAEQCSNVGNCSENNTRAKVTSCMPATARETHQQYAGWDWENPPDSLCSAGYGFAPPFTQCHATWQAQWTGTIHFAQAGQHCFVIAGGNAEGCAALYLDAEAAPLQTGSAAHCYDHAAGDFPIMWHYTMDNGSTSSLHLRYCFGGNAACTPSQALPARLLRAATP